MYVTGKRHAYCPKPADSSIYIISKNGFEIIKHFLLLKNMKIEMKHLQSQINI